MSFFSRFGKAPPSAATPVEAPAPALSTPQVPDSAAVAAQEEASLQAAIASGDAGTVATFVIDGSSTRVRQRAAEAIEDPEQIRKLIRNARGGNDNSVYKILKRKRDALLARERELEQQQADISAVATEIERHSHRPFDPLFTPHLEQLEARWNAVAAVADPAISQKTQQALDRAREVIAQHLRQIAAQAARELAAANAAAAAQARREQEESAAAVAAAEQSRVREEERKAEAEQRDAQAHALGQVGALLRKAHAALAGGSSKSAAGLRRVIEEKLAGAPPLPAHLASQLKQLDDRLQELKDWKSFSVAPKRVDLIGRMEGLIGATMHPTALAGEIKALQEQWRTLSKGAGEDIEAEWQRFHAAAQQAFQPCREFYEAQDQLKRDNLQKRVELYERLLAFDQRQDWEHPDWHMAITALRESRQLWRQHSPVDPAESEALQQQFKELTTALQGRIDAEYARNIKTKKQLIDRAGALLASADSRAATDEVKRLQEKWKSIGPVPRDEDRSLWEEFRQHCDALFQKRQQEFDSRNAVLEESRLRASALCEELEGMANLADEALLESAKKLPELRQAFDAIGELPRANARQLQDRFERAFERCRRAVAQQHSRKAEAAWMDLLDAANEVRAYRLALFQGADAAQVDALKSAAEERFGRSALPKGGLEALRSALARGGDGDPAANELALRRLCIRAEVFTENATPEEDQSLRREYQLRRLQQGMGQGAAVEKERPDALAFEWIAVGPFEEAVYLRLVERFKKCRR